MESELKVLTRQSTSQRPGPEPEPEQDERPLLKPELGTAGTAQKAVPESEESIEEMEKKYAAYVRRDMYGTMGRGRLSWTERLLLVPRLVILVPIRVVAGMTILVSYYVICRVCTAFRQPNREDGEEQEDYGHLRGWRRAVILRSGRLMSRAMLFVFGFYWISETSRGNEEGFLVNQNESNDCSKELERYGAIISNHVSYIDILYHMSSSFPSFVAKRSVSKLPLVGLISKCLGCVFVQRESKSSDFKGVSGVVTERIREAYQNEFAPKMMIFPEGTTTNGDYLLPFKTGVFLANAPVLPVILRYPFQRFSPAWDSISGARHVILLLSQFVNYIEVRRLPVYHPSEQEKEDPKLYAADVRKLMAQEKMDIVVVHAYNWILHRVPDCLIVMKCKFLLTPTNVIVMLMQGNLILSDIGLPEKRVYHAALNGNISSMPSVLHQKGD
ncbi:Phospholipid/glycerol acyltransferase family protein [Perilla frutescens var. hirtella]|nr:Phospholipid/glycerol acyltransferase family protein [Perilla frutescens var. frutescens]KAH6776520.1 Phospholipid/glycerol acyltransferase family protein [Perilla frutescens var. hirtella]